MPFDFGVAMATYEAFSKLRGLANPADQKIEQQKGGGLFPSLDDEAILLGLDQAVAKLRITDEHPCDVDGLMAMKKLTKFRSVLKSHQNTRWRKILTALDLTERFSKFLASEVSGGAPTPDEKEGEGGNQKATQQKQNNRKKMEGLLREWQRVKEDYEFTVKDPRVQHLVFVASLIKSDDPKTTPSILATPMGDFQEAYEYLLANCFDEQSLSEKTLNAVKEAQAFFASSVYQALWSLSVGGEVPADPEEQGNMLNDAISKTKDKIKVSRNQALPGYVWVIIASAIAVCGFVAYAI